MGMIFVESDTMWRGKLYKGGLMQQVPEDLEASILAERNARGIGIETETEPPKELEPPKEPQSPQTTAKATTTKSKSSTDTLS